MLDLHRLRNDIIALALLALALFVGLSLASFDPADPPSTQVLPLRVTPINLCGAAGAAVAVRLRDLFGVGSWFALLTLIAWDMKLFSRTAEQRRLWTSIGSAIAIIAFSTAVQVANPALPGAPEAGSGGYVGAMLGKVLTQHLAMPGVVLLLVAMLVSGIMLSPTSRIFAGTGRFLAAPMTALGVISGRILTAARSIRLPRRSKPAVAEPEPDEAVEWEPEPKPGTPEFPVIKRKERTFKVNKPVSAATSKPRRDERPAHSGYELPDIEILEEAEDFPYELLAEKEADLMAI